MALKAVVAKLEDVPEQFRSLYKEVNGKFRLDAEGVEFEDDVAALKNALAAEKEARRKATEKLSTLPDGFDPDEYKTLKAEREANEQKRLKQEGDWKSLEQQLVERHKADLAKHEKRIATLTGALEQRLIDAEAATVVSSMKGSVKGLLPHIKPHVKMVEEDGQFVARVVDGQGRPRVGDGQATPMTIAQLVEELKGDTELARLFDGSGSSGGGATKPAGGGGGGGPTQVSMQDSSSFIANLEGIAKGQVKVG